MKKLYLLILGLLAATSVCQAQITSPGFYGATNQPLPAPPLSSYSPPSYEPDGSFPSYVPSVPIAEAITPQIQALANGLGNNPTNIFNYVHDHIQFVLYFGSKKGAELTLLEKSGNDFDQCALVVALLAASGFTNVQYQFGWEQIPFTDYSGNGYDLQHWWQLTLSNTNWSNTVSYVGTLLGLRGYPYVYSGNDSNTFVLQRTWVSLSVGTNTYQLDPAFKIYYQPLGPGYILSTGMGSSTISNDLVSAAGGTDNGNYTESLNEASVRSKLAFYDSNFVSSIQTYLPNISVQELLGGYSIYTDDDAMLFTNATVFPTDDFDGQMPVLGWTYEPTNMMSTLQITFAGITNQWFMPQLQGQRLSLVFSNNGVAQLWQEDTLISQNSTSGSGTTNVVIYVHHPSGTWDTNNNVFINGYRNDQTATNAYQCTNATYALIYAFEPDWGWLQQRQNKLDTYLQEGFTNGSRQVTSETLNVMGLNWMLETAQTERLLANQLGVLPQHFHRIGRMAQEIGHGYYVDAYMQLTGQFPNGDANNFGMNQVQIYDTHFDLFSILFSALEHGIIEQLQNTNLVGASTVKMLEIANTNVQPIYLACSTNWTAGYNVQTNLVNYSTATLNQIYSNYISQGYYVLLPKNGSNAVDGIAGDWAGYGYWARQGTNGISTESAMIISGGYNGGYSSDPDVPIDPGFVDTTSDSQQEYYTTTPVTTPPSLGADPVDLADGTFQVQNTDLSLGQAAPRGIALSRYYNGTRRFSNPAGMAGGWVHNYSITANNVAAPQACLGLTTPAQAASMLTAITAAIQVYNGGTPDAKNWVTTALVAKWGIDQVTKSGVSISLGKDTLQFVQQPNGVFIPPANCTATLTNNGSGYNMLQRHGNTFKFDSLGRLTNIVDQYNRVMKLTYNSSNWVTNITDWTNRTFTFNYTGTPLQLTSITDGTRTVSYGYSTAYNSQGDLTSFIDADGNTNTYAYDSNHQITAVWDGESRLVVSNIYDTQGHIITQYTEGNTNETWRIYWSGWLTVQIDPAGGTSGYEYDDQGRLIASEDANGNETQIGYDGQNHVIGTLSPMSELTLYNYDGNNNLTNKIDPLGYTNTFVYDANNNLIKAIDQRGSNSTFGYNTEFSLTGSTNGAGDIVTYSYNANGTLGSRTDTAGTTSFNYDNYGQICAILYPASSGTNGFLRNSFGDVLSFTNGRGFVTSFQFNNCRQLTQTTGPTNLITQIVYDPIGNVVTNVDALSNKTVNTWSPTRKLVTTTLPTVTAGTPVITNSYDVRDWLSTTQDPLKYQPTQYTYDAGQRLVSLADPLSRTNSFGYDGDDRKIYLTNGLLQVTSQLWNSNSELIEVIDPATNVFQNAYDSVGNQNILTNRDTKVWQFLHDGANRLYKTTSPLSSNYIQVFNHEGLVATNILPDGTQTTYVYNGRNRVISRADSVGTTTYNRDFNENITNVTENGTSISNVFDAYDRLISFTDVNGYNIQYKYDANGNVTNVIYPGGRTVTNFYDALNHLTKVVDWANRQTTFTYDLDGRLTSIARPNGTVRSNNYDAAGQLTNIIEQAASRAPIAFFTMQFDNAGRVQWEFEGPPPQPYTPPTRTITIDADNRLATVNSTSVGMSGNGNLISGPLSNSTFVTYTYDARNRLTGVSGITYEYDALENRVAVTNSGGGVTTFVIDPRTSQVLMRIRSGLTNYYVYGSGLLYEENDTSTTSGTTTYHFDMRGSTVALTDTNGNVTDHVEYSAYGMTSYRVGTNDTPFLYNGRWGVQTDTNGLLYMRARYYNPYLCRFINGDPSHFGGGLNWYAYANGNPISATDPFGLGAVETAISGSWIDQVANGLGIDTSIAAQVNRQQELAQNVNAATFGLANDATIAVSGSDWDGNPVTGQQRVASATIVGFFFIPGDQEEAAAVEVAEELADKIAAEGGAYSAIGSTGQVGEQWLAQNLGGESQVFFNTTQGGRYVDQLVGDIANESKVGYQSLTPSIQLQISKDAELLNGGTFQSVNWHFFQSPVTGLGGPSQPLMNALQQNGINVIIH